MPIGRKRIEELHSAYHKTRPPSPPRKPVSPKASSSKPAAKQHQAAAEVGSFDELLSPLLNGQSLHLNEDAKPASDSVTARLWSSFTLSLRTTSWQLTFSTYKHGWDMSTLHHTLENRLPCLILFHLLAPYENIVLGAVTSSTLSPPSKTVRGDGHSTAVFALFADTGLVHFYPWVGLAAEDERSQRALTAAENLLCISSSEYMMFGSSEQFGTAALRIDKDNTSVVHTGPSDTFNNPPLLQNDIAADTDKVDSKSYSLQLKDIEIFCGPQRHKQTKSDSN